jgi:NADP-dependent 3-hydroxy acid dehydrogenase YdfG
MLEDYKRALVTGASSGIGAATVARLCERALEVHAVARRSEQLAALASKTGCITHTLDVCDTDSVYAVLGELEADVLVNNAGLGRGFDKLAQASREDIERTIDTNVTALLHVTRAVLPGMLERGRGHVVQLSSIAALYPLLSGLYGASKGAVHVLSQNLRMELQGSGIRHTEIAPGRVRTDFFETAIDDDARRQSMMGGFELLESTDIADTIVYALDTPWRVNISLIEITPTEKAPGGMLISPVNRAD